MKIVKIGLLRLETKKKNFVYFTVQILEQFEKYMEVCIIDQKAGPNVSLDNFNKIQRKEDFTDIKEIQVSNWDYFWNYKKVKQPK